MLISTPHNVVSPVFLSSPRTNPSPLLSPVISQKCAKSNLLSPPGANLLSPQSEWDQKFVRSFSDIPRPTLFDSSTDPNLLKTKQSRLPFLKRWFSSPPNRTSESDTQFKWLVRGVGASLFEGLGHHKETTGSLKSGRISYVCHAGSKKQNQDNFVIGQTSNGTHYLIVLDGHGPQGEAVSTRAAELLPYKLVEYDRMIGEGVLASVFSELDSEILKDVDCLFSGTTASLIVQKLDTFHFAHLGDSTILLLRKINGKIVGEKITTEHNPHGIEERERIMACGGVIQSFEDGIPRVILKDWDRATPLQDYTNYKQSWRSVEKNKRYLPGIALTRGLGDHLGKLCGVVSIPDVSTCKIDDKICGILIASDGLWDAFENIEEVAEEIENNTDMPRQKFLNQLSRKSRTRLLQKKGVADDVTILLWEIGAGIFEHAL